MAERIIIYPGTFDPLTYGHVDIIRRGAALGDRLVVAVSVNISKQPLFSINERVALVQDEIEKLATAGNLANPVEVRSFDGLLTEFASQQRASAILRGLRAVADFEFEFQMASINKRLHGGLETVFLMAAEQQYFVASRFVKEIALFGGDVSSFVPANVATALHSKLTQKKSI